MIVSLMAHSGMVYFDSDIGGEVLYSRDGLTKKEVIPTDEHYSIGLYRMIRSKFQLRLK
jgi:hypothetical protein